MASFAKNASRITRGSKIKSPENPDHSLNGTQPRCVQFHEYLRMRQVNAGTPTLRSIAVYPGCVITLCSRCRATFSYYQKILGFTCDYSEPDYSVVWRDNAAIHFAPGDSSPSGFDLFFWLIYVKSYFKEVKNAGANITVELGNRDYEKRDFLVRDNNCITLVFGQDLP